jgi:hypothetical protein
LLLKNGNFVFLLSQDYPSMIINQTLNDFFMDHYRESGVKLHQFSCHVAVLGGKFSVSHLEQSFLVKDFIYCHSIVAWMKDDGWSYKKRNPANGSSKRQASVIERAIEVVWSDVTKGL